MEKGSISVIIPTYFRNDNLRSTINSALNQSHKPKEIIVVDDSGESFAEPVVSDYASNSCVRYHSLKNNIGAMEAREQGVEISDGDFIQFLDDDDQLRPKKFERQLGLFADPEIGVVYSGIKVGNESTVSPQESVRGDILKEALAFDTWPCCISTMLIDSNIYNQIRPIPNKGEDARIKIELAQRTKFDYINEPLVKVGIETDASLSNSDWQVSGLETILKDYTDLYTKHPDSHQQAMAQYAKARARLTRKTELDSAYWSFNAVKDSFMAAWYSTDDRAKQMALAVASLAGSPGIETGEYIYKLFAD